jgi:NTP pyrophosphatase (non-canonical NTP hydrolase)
MIEKVYKEIKEIDSTDKCTISEAFCKFTEESGEWIREINKTTGRKLNKDGSDLKETILEEAADTLQNFLLICGRFDIEISDLLKEVEKKNQKWKGQVVERQKVVNIGDTSYF